MLLKLRGEVATLHAFVKSSCTENPIARGNSLTQLDIPDIRHKELLFHNLRNIELAEIPKRNIAFPPVWAIFCERSFVFPPVKEFIVSRACNIQRLISIKTTLSHCTRNESSRYRYFSR